MLLNIGGRLHFGVEENDRVIGLWRLELSEELLDTSKLIVFFHATCFKVNMKLIISRKRHTYFGWSETNRITKIMFAMGICKLFLRKIKY